jgi:hypothetical protein
MNETRWMRISPRCLFKIIYDSMTLSEKQFNDRNRNRNEISV